VLLFCPDLPHSRLFRGKLQVFDQRVRGTVPGRARISGGNRMRASGTVGAAMVVALSLLAAGCGGGGGGDAAAAAPGPNVDVPAPVGPTVDPFVAGNKWLPLKPGTQWVREGTTKIGNRQVTHKVISTVTDVVREIDGMKAVAVLDEERGGGELTDKSVDWLAQDSAGNIFWVGGITEQFQAGRSTGIDEAWASGFGKARRGLLVPADPASRRGTWGMAEPPDTKPEVAKFDRIQDKECVPFGCYQNVVVVEEGVHTSETEYKYYAPGIGQIRNEPKKGHDEDVERLSNLTSLSADGLTEAANDALRLDAQAIKDKANNYGQNKAARAS
jgi:hypothetical protein